MYHTFHLYQQLRHSSKYSSVGIITVNMALVETITPKKLPVTTNNKDGIAYLLEISFSNHTIVVEPQSYEDFHPMIDQMSQK